MALRVNWMLDNNVVAYSKSNISNQKGKIIICWR